MSRDSMKYMVCYLSGNDDKPEIPGTVFGIVQRDTLEESNAEIDQFLKSKKSFSGKFIIVPYYEPEQRSASDLSEGQALPE